MKGCVAAVVGGQLVACWGIVRLLRERGGFLVGALERWSRLSLLRCVSPLLRGWVVFACAAGAPTRRATSGRGAGRQSVCIGGAGGGCGWGWVFWACSVTYWKQPVGMHAITAAGVVLMWLLWLAMRVRRLGCVILVKQGIKADIFGRPAVTTALSTSVVTPVTASGDRDGVKALFLASNASNSTFTPSATPTSRTFSAPHASGSHIVDLHATHRDTTAPPAPQPHKPDHTTYETAPAAPNSETPRRRKPNHPQNATLRKPNPTYPTTLTLRRRQPKPKPTDADRRRRRVPGPSASTARESRYRRYEFRSRWR